VGTCGCEHVHEQKYLYQIEGVLHKCKYGHLNSKVTVMPNLPGTYDIACQTDYTAMRYKLQYMETAMFT
jgi:hypothetical protein